MKNLVLLLFSFFFFTSSSYSQYSLSTVNKVSGIIKKNPKASPEKLAGLISSSVGDKSSKTSREALISIIKARRSYRGSIKAVPVAHRIYDHVLTSLVSMKPGVPAEWCEENRYRFEFSMGLISGLIKKLTDCISENTSADVVGMLDNVLLNPSRLLGQGDYSEMFRDCEEQIEYLTNLIDFIGDYNGLCH